MMEELFLWLFFIIVLIAPVMLLWFAFWLLGWTDETY